MDRSSVPGRHGSWQIEWANVDEMMSRLAPSKQGLYDPKQEHDACGIGFLVDLKGRSSHKLVQQAVQMLLNLEHRGACGCEENTGDGAGLLLQVPHRFFSQVCPELGISLPSFQDYGVGMVFLPPDTAAGKECERLFERTIREEGQQPLGWRTVPVDNTLLGATARRGQPLIRQVFIGRSQDLEDELAFERKLYVIRKRVERAVKASQLPNRDLFYIPSLSYKTIVYKGMLMAGQLTDFYPELLDPAIESALVLVHSRFSTNTFPNWSRAHPYRYLSHNGEINTLRGNVNWMHARQGLLRSELMGSDMEKILPIIDEDGSDSAMFDNALEMLVLTGRSLPHAIMMMIPEPWHGNPSMSEEKRAFYQFHSCLMEPWDGPASIAFTDGRSVGAVLDRNGLRPSRYYVTTDDLVIMASEVGVLDIPPERVSHKGRLEPGRMFLVDTRQGRIIADDELKHQIASRRPYSVWLGEHLVDLERLPKGPASPALDSSSVKLQQKIFGYTSEELELLLRPMAENGVEALGSMGTDTPLAALSDHSQLLYNYFTQLFAQVTNPPVDAIREALIMSLETTLGAERNLLEPGPTSVRQIKLNSPVLRDHDLTRFRGLDGSGPGEFRSATLSILCPSEVDGPGLDEAMSELCTQASQAVGEGHEILILSDRGANQSLAPLPALLATSGVHHHLIREGTRTRVALVLESGEPREVHHFALLIGYGAAAVNPYLAFATLRDLLPQEQRSQSDLDHAIENYIKAVNKGVVKVMSKMGISTAQSYRGAQVYEAIGLDREFVKKYFTWTASRLSGVGQEVVAREIRLRHRRAFPPSSVTVPGLESGGQYQWRSEGEYHVFNPQTVHKLQYACRTGNYEVFREYSQRVNEQTRQRCTLRGLFDLQFLETPIPIEEVEPIAEIVKRFKTGAMSYGSISKEAHESLAVAMNRIGGKSNTGEGGEESSRYVPDENGDSRNSAIKQVASGRFGVTSEYLVNASELQIKMAQGAKPGEGGQLPGHKVYPWIAEVRHSTPGVGLISPPPHHDIYSIEDLAELIHDLKNANNEARISVKLVAEVGVGTIAAGVAKGHADVVLISGHDGGTGASPLTSIKHAGAPWELGLAETHQVLLLNNLRSRIVVEVDGQLKTGRDVVIGALLGAEEFGFATAPLVALGCIMMRVCHLNTCPVGVATQDPVLRERFTGDPSHVVNFMRFLATEVRELMALLGFRTLNEMVGRTDLLRTGKAVEHWKGQGLDFSDIFYRPPVAADVGRFCQIPQNHGLAESLDHTELMELCRPALESADPVEATLPIRNRNRVVGTSVGSEVTRRHGARGLLEDTIKLHFKGSAGQSFGAFIPPGMTMTLEGDSNDYIGKGLSGGKIIVHPAARSRFLAEENVIIGNVAFYGATAGEAYIRGIAGERFCVRNSGVKAVVEAVGDHACEYMTGGCVVVLGPTGRNFAAGMSGGIAFVLDQTGDFASNCNQAMVELFPLEDPEDLRTVTSMLERHVSYTDSEVGRRVLASWESLVPKFVKVYPTDYRRVIEAQNRVLERGLPEEEMAMAAFQLNAGDAARVDGQ